MLAPLISYLLEIDRKKWAAFKARLKPEGRTVKWAMEALIDYVINYGMPVPPAKKKDKPDA